MIEKILFDYLTENAGVQVYLEKRDASGEYIVIEKTGSRTADKIETATIAIQSYADSMHRAASINEAVKDLMQDTLTLPEISAVRLNTDYNYTDITTKIYRYQAVYDITYYRS